MSPRKKIIRMLLVALGVIAICCILLRTASCSTTPGSTGSIFVPVPTPETKPA